MTGNSGLHRTLCKRAAFRQDPRVREATWLAWLRGVSRSFYLTVRVLPRKVREPVGIAYLLARAADTIADTDALPVERRIETLRRLRERIVSHHTEDLELDAVAAGQSSPAERKLLRVVEYLINRVDTTPPETRDPIRNVLDTIISGQELDLERFGAAGGDRLLALQTDAELDDYTYRVAGCVGEFWTKVTRIHLFPTYFVDFKRLLARSVRFGKGLQLVNILRDFPRDLRQGRCYLPELVLREHGLIPEDLLDPANGARFRPLYTRYLLRAEDHLAVGWQYALSLPYRQMRLRLACAWPLLIGLRTLALLRVGNVLDPEHHIKVSRPQVRSIMLRSTLLYPVAGLWGGMFDRARRHAAP